MSACQANKIYIICRAAHLSKLLCWRTQACAGKLSISSGKP